MVSSNSLYFRPAPPSRFFPFTKQSLCLFTLCGFFATTLTGNSFAQDNALDLSDLSLDMILEDIDRIAVIRGLGAARKSGVNLSSQMLRLADSIINNSFGPNK